MKNYKAYQGDVSVEMSLERGKTITIIHGEMGKGKTTLLGAIYWCLYGEERSVSDSDEGILNNDVLNQLRVGDGVETSVEMSLYEQSEIRYKIKRSVRFDKKSESIKSKQDELVGSLPDGIEITEDVEYRELPPRSEGDDWIVLDDSSRIRDRIENLFPKSLSSYFLFDAELLDKFFRADDEKLVKNGIEKISGMPIIDNANKHLSQSADAIMKEIKKPNLEPIMNQMSHWKRTRKDCEDKIASADLRLEGINSEIASNEHFLRSHSEESIESTQNELDAITANMKKISQIKAKNQQDMNSALLSYSVLLQLKDVMESSIKQCDVWEKEGKIPIAVSKHALSGILRGKPPMCICGAPLEEGSAGRHHIEDLLEKNLAESPVIHSISTGRGHWGDMVDKVGKARSEIAGLRAERNGINSDYDQQNSRRKERSHILETHDLEEIQRRAQIVRDRKGEKRELDGDKAVAVEKKKRAGRELAKLDHDYSEHLKHDSKYKSQSNRRELAKTLSDLLSSCRADLIEDMRGIVAKKTEEYFFKFVSKDNFAKIEIHPDYKTVVVGHDGKRKALSAGQSCCLALSYIASIRDIAEKNYFMVIDSPFHNISQAERVDIARNLPKFIPGTQITLLVQDQEYTGSAKKGIIGGDIQSVRKTLIDNESLWREYLLTTSKDPGDTSDSTSIETVGVQ